MAKASSSAGTGRATGPDWAPDADVKPCSLGFDTVSMMRDGDCPYLRLEKTARRLRGLTFERPGPLEVSEVWYCRHPFHGVEVPLSGERREAQRACAACRLPGGAGASLAAGGRGGASADAGGLANHDEDGGATPA
jgi:hypothetical protein